MTHLHSLQRTGPSRFLCLLALLAPLAAFGQAFQPGQSLALSVSHGSASDVTRGALKGRAEVLYYDFQYKYASSLGEGLLLSTGVSYDRTDFTLEGALPLPETLQEFSLRVGMTKRLSPEWALFASVSPGYYGSGSSLSSEAFTVPVLAGASYAQSRELRWSFGAAYREFSEYPVLPYIGVNWTFAPRWTLAVGYPETGVAYEMSETLSLRLGVSAKAGSLWVGRVPGHSGGEGGTQGGVLRDTYLDYRELRVGGGLDYRLTPNLNLLFQAGWVANRKFDFHKTDEVYDGDSAAYLSFSLRSTF